MKVLQVIDSGGLYGAERVLLALMGALRTQGIEVVLASIAEPGMADKALEVEARAQGHEVWRVAMPAGPARSAARALIDRCREEGFSILHTHGYKANTLLAGIPRARRGLPAVSTLHGWTSTRRLSRMRLYETVERLALRRADRVVAVSQAMVERWRLERRYGRRLCVIPNGIPAPRLGAAKPSLPPTLAAFMAGRPTVFAAGRLSREKGFDVLLQAVARVRSTGLDACLVLAGDGNERSTLERLAADLGLTDAVLMPGYIDNAGELMRAFDAVAIPSRTEGLPVVLLEALLAGVPVAATAVGSMPEVMNACEAGRCVPVQDEASLGSRLDNILRGDTSDAARLATSRAAQAHYSADAMANRYVELYRELGDVA